MLLLLSLLLLLLLSSSLFLLVVGYYNFFNHYSFFANELTVFPVAGTFCQLSLLIIFGIALDQTVNFYKTVNVIFRCIN